MLCKFVPKSLSIGRKIINNQSLLTRRFQINSLIKSSIKNDPKNSNNPSYPSEVKKVGDFKDIEIIENLMLKKEKPVASYIIQPRKKLQSLSEPSYWIDLVNKTKSKKQIRQSKSPIQRKLILRTMSDSYVEEFLPFKSDPDLLEEYVNSDGGIRIGKIFEDLDLLAANISYKHCVIEKENYSNITIVTASVDRLDLIKSLPICDIRLNGHISYVGYSSMEVLIKMEALQDGVFQNLQTSSETNFQGETLMITRFIMVARDPFTDHSIQINPLQLENNYQKKLFQIAEEQKNRRRASAAAALTRLPPTEEEKLLIHDCYLEYCKYANQKEKIPDNILWMDETTMESVTFMQPQNRNIHGFVFGGYLMKLAYELAFSNASVFLKSRPTFLALDEISFRKPVQIGSILIMSSQIVYAPGSPHRSFQVMVMADVLDIERVSRDTTNIFHFTFNCDNSDIKVRRVMPKTYDESMKYVEGRRRRRIGLKLRGLYNEISDKRMKTS
ncbi:HotDog domain-containing protein [Glomus cerebriforme]|uniref:HotDog domain-containing protein n=1 Tax=Glomus cerebriforme TaxID=658196 RepID=A0A397T589_9GLOM|nr:HotDog domain-containing protein [Glomus cerebriforme]